MWTGAGTQFGFDFCVIMLRLGAHFTRTCPRAASEGLGDAQTRLSPVENSRSKAGGRSRIILTTRRQTRLWRRVRNGTASVAGPSQ